MSRVGGKIDGRRGMSGRFKSLSPKLEAEIKKAVQDSVFLIHSTAIKSIQDNSSGTKQKRYKPDRTVRASKPGNPPNTDTGRLVKSIDFNFENGGLTGEVGTNLKYGRYLEFGTQNMEPRPWLSVAARSVKGKMSKIFKQQFKNSVKKAGKK